VLISADKNAHPPQLLVQVNRCVDAETGGVSHVKRTTRTGMSISEIAKKTGSTEGRFANT